MKSTKLALAISLIALPFMQGCSSSSDTDPTLNGENQNGGDTIEVSSTVLALYSDFTINEDDDIQCDTDPDNELVGCFHRLS